MSTVNIVAAIREATDALDGWPGHVMNSKRDALVAALPALKEVLEAARPMAFVHLAKGNDSGRRKQLRLRNALARIGGDA